MARFEACYEPPLGREVCPLEGAIERLSQLRRQIEDISVEIAGVEASLGQLRHSSGLARWPQTFKLYSLKFGLDQRLDEMQGRYRMVRNSYLQLLEDEANRNVARVRR